MKTTNDFVRWTTPSNNLPVRYDPVAIPPQPLRHPNRGVSSMLGQISKNLAVKFVGATRPTENLVIMPGTTTRDVLRELGLGAGFQLGDARNDTVFPPDDVLFARVHDGDLLHVSAMVDASC